MTYELAKQLKEAGFPQEERDGVVSGKSDYIGNHEEAYFPTLSELIEACGEKLKSLDHEPVGWFALATIEFPCHDGCTRKANAMWGETPEEAIANLWLKLNKKK